MTGAASGHLAGEAAEAGGTEEAPAGPPTVPHQATAAEGAEGEDR